MMRSYIVRFTSSTAPTLSVVVVTSMFSVSRMALTASHTLASSSTTSDRNLSIDRQPHGKRCPPAFPACHLDVPAVLLDDAVAHGKAEPRSFRHLLRGKKG